MKAVLVVLLAFLAACQLGTQKASIGRMVDRTVRVDVTCPHGQGWGSGVILGAHPQGGTVVATAAHVVDDMACSWKVGGEETFRVAYDEELDLALLRLDRPTKYPLLESDVYLGQPVIVTGWPKQLRDIPPTLTVSRGHVMALWTAVARISASVYFGSSGGPVWDEEGRLVGIVSFLHMSLGIPMDDQYYIVPAKAVFEMYRSLW